MSTETKNYITPTGWQALKDELYHLVNKERPEIVQIVNWAASNGDRSENGDYLSETPYARNRPPYPLPN